MFKNRLLEYSSVISIYILQILKPVSPQTAVFLFVVLLILLLISFITSGAEIAMFSLQPKEVNVLKTKQHASARRIVSLLEERKAVYTSLLIAGGICNICIIILTNFLLRPYLHFDNFHFIIDFNPNILIKIIIITILLLLFGKMLPKVWASQNALRFAYTTSSTVEAIHLVLRQLSLRMVNIADRINKTSGANESEATSMKELDDAIEINDVETSVEEKNILKGIVKFSNISVKQIMRFRLDVNGIEYNTSFPDLLKKIEELHYSRLPIFKNSLDEIVGILNTKDLVQYVHEKDFDWHILIRPTLFVPETKLIKHLLQIFQTKRIHFAVVVDEFGGTSGIVTMEDILEEIIGDIRDEFDEEDTALKKLDDHTYIADAKILLYDLCRGMRLPIDTFDEVKGESDSLGGVVLEKSGKFPAVNEKIVSGDFEFTVLEIDKNRIKTIQIHINQSTDE